MTPLQQEGNHTSDDGGEGEEEGGGGVGGDHQETVPSVIGARVEVPDNEGPCCRGAVAGDACELPEGRGREGKRGGD